MKNLFLLSSFIILISITPLLAFGIANTPWIPPTNAFDKIHSSNGTVNSVNYSMPLTIQGANGVTVTSSNKTHTVIITGSGTGGTNQGTYNKTLANNVLVNSLGNRINFINGSNSPISLINDPIRNQVNITISSSSGSGSITGSQNIGKGTNSQGVLSSATATTIRGKNVTSLRTDLITISSSNTTDINLSSTFKSNSITCTNQFFSAFSNTTGLYTCATPLNTAQIGNADNGESLFSSRSNATKNLLMTIRNSSAYVLWNHNTTSITPSFQFKVNTLSCPANSAIISYNNSTGLLTCQAFGSGSGTIIGSQNVGKSTGSVGVLSTASSTIIKGRNFTGTSPIVISKTNDTDVSVSCPTCGTLSSAITTINSQTGPTVNIVGSNGNITITNSTNQVKINTGYDVPHLSQFNNFTKNQGIGTSLNPTLFINNTSDVGAGTASGQIRFSTTNTASKSITLAQLLSTVENDVAGSESGLLRYLVSFNGVRTEYMRIDPTDNLAYDGAVFKVSSGARFVLTNMTQNTAITDPSAHAGWFWLSSTNTDIYKYSSSSTIYNIVSTKSQTNATTGQLSGNGTGTSSTTLKMDGIYATLTPANTGRITVTVSGVAADSVISDGCLIGIRQSTSNMGVNGAVLAGSLLGGTIKTNSAAAAQILPFSRTYDFTGTVGTKYFFDLSFAAITGGTCTLSSVNWDLVEH